MTLQDSCDILEATTPVGASSTPAVLPREQSGTSKEWDIEIANPYGAAQEQLPQGSNLITWDGPADVANPQNWPMRQKWRATVVVSLFTFISPLSSAMVAPALPALGKDLGLKSGAETEMALSIFVLGYAIGPLLFGPLSEVFGRSRVLQISNLFYLIWNLACGFAQNPPDIFIFRFLAGIGGSAPLSVGGGTLSDCWHPDQRGKAVGVYSLAPLLGPAIGPAVAGFIAEYSTWRWVFWSTTIAAGAVQLVGFLFMKETYAPTILRRKRDRLIEETGNTKLYVATDSRTAILGRLSDALVRPAWMLASQPIVQVIAVYMAYLFGLTYLISVTFPHVWSDVYGETVGISGLNFISIGVGCLLGAFVNMAFVDRIYGWLKQRNSNVGLPEFRVPSMFVGSVLIPIGLFWYGWSVQARIHWIMPNLGITILNAGTIICLQGMQGYVIDSYQCFAASGIAAAVVLRSLAGFAFPLIASQLYKSLGYGWGCSLLAFISIVIGIPGPFLFYFYGFRLRARSQYAAG